MLKLINAKQIAVELSISEKTAQKYVKQIRSEYNLKAHLIPVKLLYEYFGIELENVK